MLNKIANTITEKICYYNPRFTDREKKLISFGMECALSEVSKVIIYFIVFLAFSLQEYFFVAMVVFYIARAFAGGYHSETYLQCLITTFTIFLIIITFGRYVELNMLMKITLLAISLVLTMIFAPVDHPNKPILNKKRRFILKALSVLFIMFVGVLAMFLNSRLSGTVVYAYSVEAILLPIGYYVNKKGGQNNKHLRSY